MSQGGGGRPLRLGFCDSRVPDRGTILVDPRFGVARIACGGEKFHGNTKKRNEGFASFVLYKPVRRVCGFGGVSSGVAGGEIIQFTLDGLAQIRSITSAAAGSGMCGPAARGLNHPLVPQGTGEKRRIA